MQWINNYQLFLFDFDGLLVNTEEIHYQAYKQMCANRGFNLDWSFPRYCEAGHYHAEGLRTQIYAHLPELLNQEPKWEVLYQEKKQMFMHLLKNGSIQIMPGVEKLLSALQESRIQRCVVTHSPPELVYEIRDRIPILNTIPYWITRTDYTHPKPNPECYQIAIQKLAKVNDRIIGFEDTPRGLKALLGTQAKAVLVSGFEYPELPEYLSLGAQHFHNFDSANTKLS